MNSKRWIVVFIFIAVFCACRSTSCTLGDHNWMVHAMIRLTPDFLLPFWAEFSQLENDHFASDASEGIFVCSRKVSPYLGIISLPFISSWSGKFSWKTTFSNDGLMNLARNAQEKKKPTIIVGIDNPRLTIALLADINSDNICRQMTILYETRMRSLSVGCASPMADEYYPRFGISIIFYGLPFPDKIMSLTAGIEGQNPILTIENPRFVAELITRKAIKKRMMPATSSALIFLDREN